MRILVTGTDGYIGTVLVPLLIERGHYVSGIDTGFYRDGCLYDNIVPPHTYTSKDVRHITAADVQDIEAVVHLAELSNDPLGQFNPAITHDINFEGSVAFAQTCKRAGVERFVYASSCSVYGIGGDDIKNETSLPQPQTAYAQCKVLVEQHVSPMADSHFSPTFLRNATAFGASPRMRFDIVLNNLAGLAWTTNQIRMTSNGSPWRPLVHVQDICRAIACVLEAPREAVHAEIFNVGDSAQNYQVREIAEAVAQVFSDCELIFGTNDADTRSYRVAFNKIHEHLPNFRCSTDVVSGARELFTLFKHIEFTKDSFEFRAYTRIHQLMYLLSSGQLDDQLFWNTKTTNANTYEHANTVTMPLLH